MARKTCLPEQAEGMGAGDAHGDAAVLRRIMDAVPVGIALFDADQRFRFANKSYQTYTGQSPAEMIGKTLAEVAWAESYQIAQPYAERALAGETVEFVNVIPADDGGSLTVAVSYIPDRRPDGTASGFFSLVEDITARDTAEKARRHSEALLRLAADNLPVLISYIDKAGILRFTNEEDANWYGKSVDTMVGRPVRDTIGDDSYAEVEQYFDAALSGLAVNYQRVATLKDGSKITIEAVYVPDVDDSGEVNGFFAQVQDISDRKHAEEALRHARENLERRVEERTRELTDANAQLLREFDDRQRAEEALRDSEFRYRHLFDASPIGVWEEDYSGAKRVIDGLKAQGVIDFRRHFRDHPEALRRAVQAITIIDVNEATLKIHGASDKQAFIRGRTEKRRELAHFYVEELAMLAQGKLRSTQEAPLRRYDGTTAVVRNISIISDAYAETWERLITTEEDITERRHAEDAMRQARDDADQASRAKSNFLANMSHELRTPLNAIMGFAEMISTEMLGTIENTKYCDYATDIGKSGQHLLKLIDDILDLSKIESGKLDLNETDVDIAAMVDACTPLVARRAEQGGVALHVEIPPDLPAIRGDERRLKQIVINLMANAVSFTPNGGRVSVGASVEPSGDFAFWVSDTGVGIAPEDLATVMEVFGQVGDVFSREHRGSGLGLPFSKGLAERRGGTLQIESTLGAGTTATLRLPAERTVTAQRAGA